MRICVYIHIHIYFFFFSCYDIETLSGTLTHILPNYCATFLPMAAIMIINPILYCSSTQDARFIISVRLGQYTEKERKAVDGIKTKFLIIILTFYICWLPNLICGVLIWSLWIHLSESVIIFLWYCMVSIYFDTFIKCFNSVFTQLWWDIS
jgi:ocular albinism type 1 protein